MQTFYSTLHKALVGWYANKRDGVTFSQRYFDFNVTAHEYCRLVEPFMTTSREISVDMHNVYYDRAMLISSGALPSEL